MTPLLPATAATAHIERDTVVCMDALEALRRMDDESVNCIVTSPPYFGLRDYGIAGQIGLEDTPAAYVERLRVLFSEARRVLRDDGVLWLNIGDSYNSNRNNNQGTGLDELREWAKQAKNIKGVPAPGLGEKQLLGIPWRVAFALQDDGWILRSDVIWAKPNPMPESVTDRPTKSHEYVFLFSRQPRYWYDADAIKESCVDGDPSPPRGSEGVGDNKNSGRRKQDEVGKRTYVGFNDRWDNRQEPLTHRNARTVWTIATQPNSLAHFAMMPPELARRCILAGCPRGGVVLDPFFGGGTTGIEAHKLGRHYIGFEINPVYVTLATNRLRLGDETTKAIERGDPYTMPLFEEAI